MKSNTQVSQYNLFVMRVSATQHEWFKKFKDECVYYFVHGKLPRHLNTEAELEMFILCQLSPEQRLDLADELNNRLLRVKNTYFIPLLMFVGSLPNALLVSSTSAVLAAGACYAKYENLTQATQVGLASGFSVLCAFSIYKQLYAPERQSCYLARIERFANVLQGLGVHHMPTTQVKLKHVIDLPVVSEPKIEEVFEPANEEEAQDSAPEDDAPWFATPSPSPSPR